MEIKSIHIKNIRGFKNNTFTVNIQPNRPNILVAPNGFGKSSISTAFNSAKGNKLNVSEKDKHHNDQNTPSALTIEWNNKTLKATSVENEITAFFDIHVVKSNIEPKAKLPKINGFTVAKPYLEIPSLDLGPATKKEKIQFNYQAYKKLLEPNSKLAPNFSSKCDDIVFRQSLHDVWDQIDKLKQVKTSKFLDEVVLFASKTPGIKAEINKKVENKYAERICEFPNLKIVFDTSEKFFHENSWIDNIIICHILMKLNTDDRANLKNWLNYAIYARRIQSARKFIADINSAWVTAEIKETKGRALVVFPDASSLSNGQRDLLYFGCSLLKALNSAIKKSCLLFIDEVFDYLDDANIVVAQYFISKIIEIYKREGSNIYVCLMTHLDPAFFKGYAFKRQNVIYLGNSGQVITNTMKNIILNREDPVWKEEISRYFLHYHPDNFDISNVFNNHYGLPKKHGKSHEFYEFLEQEWNKCIADADTYDPFAVCAYVRIQIERCIYNKIECIADRQKFLDACNGTSNKLKFAEELGVVVPEVCFLLGSVYNEAMHQKDAVQTSSTIALRLRNLALQNIMKQAINW